MKRFNRFHIITTVVLSSLIFIWSCKPKDDPAPSANGPIKYFVGVEVDDDYYMVPTHDILSGKISVLGNGIEGIAHHAVVKDSFLYVINSGEQTLDKYKVSETSITKVDAISSQAVMSGSFARYTDLTETNDIIMMNFPNASGQAPYAIVDLATFTVESYGSFQMPDIKHYKPSWARTLVSGTKAYVSAEYSNPDVYGDIPDSLITIVYDYPSFTNPTILVNPASSGTVAGYRTPGAFKDELGDIYQYNLRSKQWSIDEEDVDKASAVFVRIKNGQYDEYVLDVSSHFDEPVSVWNAWYAGNGIAYANVIKESDLAIWDDLYENYGQLCKIDLYNKTVTPLNIPKAPLNEIFSLNSVENGKFYIPVCIKNGNANIYEVTIGGGANDFRVGAELDGNNVYVPSLNVLK